LTQKIVTRVQEIITCSSDLINHFRYHKIYNQLWQGCYGLCYQDRTEHLNKICVQNAAL
jgi:hypothetical protein